MGVPMTFLQIGIEQFIYQWEVLGVYQFLLPFLLIFAVVFGILSYMNIFGGQKGIHIIIALVIGLLAIRVPIFADVLREVTPRLGVGLVIILSALILTGIFVPKAARGVVLWIMFGIGAIVFLIILGQLWNVFNLSGFAGFSSGGNLIPIIVLVGLFIAVIVALSLGGESSNSGFDELKHKASQLFGS
jgi:hypothetical protein